MKNSKKIVGLVLLLLILCLSFAIEPKKREENISEINSSLVFEVNNNTSNSNDYLTYETKSEDKEILNKEDQELREGTNISEESPLVEEGQDKYIQINDNDENKAKKSELTQVDNSKNEEFQKEIEKDIINDEISDKLTCTLVVRCDTILKNMDMLDEEKKHLVPSDGIIFENKNAPFNEGESVFDLLLRELKESNIHFEFTKTPLTGGVYIEGINNLYEFDCGELSGWTYRVNGIFHNFGCSDCILENNDVVEILYTCDLGKDVNVNLKREEE